jgi:hypothetical protein
MKRIIYFLATVMLFTLQSCKKKCYEKANPECENFDPCYSKEVVSADFKIEEIIGYNNAHPNEDTTMSETDTVWQLNPVRFTPKQNFDSVTWIIGSEMLHDRSVVRGGFPINTPIAITLIAYRKPALGCFPNDDGIDTVTKYVVSRRYQDLPICGKFLGYNEDNQSDKFIISFNDSAYCPNFLPDKLNPTQLGNLPKGQPGPDSCMGIDGFQTFGGRCLSFNKKGERYSDSYQNVNFISHFGMSARLDYNNGELIATYSYDDEALKNYLAGSKLHTPAKIISKTFKGKKL